MNAVQQEAVVTEWIRAEQEKGASLPVAELESWAYPDKMRWLLKENPKAASVFWKFHGLRWYELEFTKQDLRSLHHVWSDRSLPQGVMTVAEMIAEGTIDERYEKIVEQVEQLASLPSDEFPDQRLIVTKPRQGVPMRVNDGNHRATALALRLLRTGEFLPPAVYIGFGHGRRASTLMSCPNAVITALRRGWWKTLLPSD